MNQQQPSSSNFRQSPGVQINGTSRYGNQMSLPPPLPPRRQFNNYGSFNNMRSSFPGGYNNNYGSFSPYNSYPYRSHYPGNYNNNNFNGPSGDVESRLIQYAEETSRPAFESIESIISTFSSITIMLESTFFAMSSSFNAILSVADNIGKARNMFGQILNTFALIRFAKWLYRWILFKFGLRQDDPNVDSLWKKAVIETVNGKQTGPTTWPIYLFLSLLFGIPYLVHKIIKNVDINKPNENNLKDWLEMNDPVFSATAIYDFNAVTPSELSIKTGQKIWLAPKSIQPKNNPGWHKATDSVNIGLVPSNYIQIVGEMKKKINHEIPKYNDINSTMEETFDYAVKTIKDDDNGEKIIEKSLN